jgi:hypothetical protein
MKAFLIRLEIESNGTKINAESGDERFRVLYEQALDKHIPDYLEHSASLI